MDHEESDELKNVFKVSSMLKLKQSLNRREHKVIFADL